MQTKVSENSVVFHHHSSAKILIFPHKLDFKWLGIVIEGCLHILKDSWGEQTSYKWFRAFSKKSAFSLRSLRFFKGEYSVMIVDIKTSTWCTETLCRLRLRCIYLAKKKFNNLGMDIPLKKIKINYSYMKNKETKANPYTRLPD